MSLADWVTKEEKLDKLVEWMRFLKNLIKINFIKILNILNQTFNWVSILQQKMNFIFF